MRVAACFMVMLTHSCEPFYLGGEGSLVMSESDAFWVAVLNTLPRAAVALFVVASSYLQFPLHYSTGEFFRKRAVRILVPFLIWTVVYALVWGEPVQNFKDLLLNFNYAAGHLWFVYMIVGLYLVMPMLSPWAEKVGRKELLVYLGIWLFTTLIPFIRQWAGGPAPVIYGPSGIPNPAKFPLWGEASWNTYGVFYYVSGFIGYLLLGLYFRKFVPELSWKKTLAIALPLFACGFAIGSVGFFRGVMGDSGGVFPFEGPVGIAALWEIPWMNDGSAVALMTIAWILLFRKIKGPCPGIQRRLWDVPVPSPPPWSSIGLDKGNGAAHARPDPFNNRHLLCWRCALRCPCTPHSQGGKADYWLTYLALCPYFVDSLKSRFHYQKYSLSL